MLPDAKLGATVKVVVEFTDFEDNDNLLAVLGGSLVDTETLISYLDRYLMYYIRTADRLQRTAPWVDSLDGGLDRVRAVVVDDVLGLGSELESAMAQHVDGYFDEWKATIDDPARVRRFRTFVNVA